MAGGRFWRAAGIFLFRPQPCQKKGFAMRRLLLIPALLLLLSPAAAGELTIRDGSTAVVTLSDGSTINMRFTVGAGGSTTWIGALGRDQWFSPIVNGGSPAPSPTPTPGPNPPTPPTPPTPPVPPTPQKVRILLLVNSGPIESWTDAQRKLFASCLDGSLRDWAEDHCLIGPNEKTPEWRLWPSNTTTADAETRFVPLVEAAGGQPSMVVQVGEAGPITRIDIPADATAAIDKLERLAGLRANPPPRQLHVIDDMNFRQLVGIRATGYVRGLNPPNLPRFAAEYQLIPRSQWSALIKEGKGTFLGDLMRAAKIPCKDQGSLGYCWVYASTSCVELVRALQGQPLVVLSPESVGGPVTNWRNQGGWGYDALEQLTKVGACRADFMDSPNSLSPRRWKDGWVADCDNHRITNAWATIDDGGFDGVMTAALLRLPVSIGLSWWQHQVLVTGPVDLGGGKFGVEFRNSWGSDYGDDGFDVLTESKAQPSGSFACISVGVSDREINSKSRGTAVDLVRLRQKTVAKRIVQYQQAQ